MMAGIRAKNTKPEIAVRKLLHGLGFRFRLHRKDLPGKPDIVLPKWRVAIFVHGCFWHGHNNCRLFRFPKSRPEFWETKIGANIARDKIDSARLAETGWRVLQIWECALKGRNAIKPTMLSQAIVDFVTSADCQYGDIRSAVTATGKDQ